MICSFGSSRELPIPFVDRHGAIAGIDMRRESVRYPDAPRGLGRVCAAVLFTGAIGDLVPAAEAPLTARVFGVVHGLVLVWVVYSYWLE